jgi:hypothetical protein
MRLDRKWVSHFSFASAVFVFFTHSVFAGTPVRFASDDLRAFVQLVKPELSALRLDGRRGEFLPGPALRFVGLETEIFDIDLNLGANLVDLRFNNLRAKTPVILFEKDRVRVDIAFEDQSKAIRSTLGSISIKNLMLTAWIRFSSDGSPRLVYETGTLSGELKGTGLLKPKWVITELRKLAMKVLKAQLERQLGRTSVTESVEQGLVTWARFSTDPRMTRFTPGTAQISSDALTFEAE